MRPAAVDVGPLQVSRHSIARVRVKHALGYAHDHFNFDLQVGAREGLDTDAGHAWVCTLEEALQGWKHGLGTRWGQVDDVDAHHGDVLWGCTDGVEAGLQVTGDQLCLACQCGRWGSAARGPGDLA